MNFGDLSDDFFLTDKDQNKILVSGYIPAVGDKRSIVDDGVVVMYAKQSQNLLIQAYFDQARGASATCFLEVMHDASYLTCFSFLRAPDSSEPMPDPFSPISHE
ncbi:hypothetical protein Nepgr_004507 [Nepenthes gracilis]|uniref:Uncharacterized protein n=1 Tax=Nepenthes gracilis TaxID=150966 RepID=A0AAD3XF92_NEPGR|nr:hypothetical protein Nepgr_004507 [Nepenthes gracilis]